MSILHDCIKAGWIGITTEFVLHINHDENDKFVVKLFDSTGWYSLNKLSLMFANEMSKPLELSDFVRPDELTYAGNNKESDDADLEAWKNWTSLFDGWERDKNGWLIKGTLSLHQDSLGRWVLYEYRGLAPALVMKDPTREDLIRTAKSHNIDLLSK